MSKYAYKRVGGKWQLIERKTNRVVPVGERPTNWFKQIGKGIKKVYDATEGKRQKLKREVTDKALAYTGNQTKGLTDKLVWDERTLAGGELYDAKRGPLTISQAKKLERENLAIYKRDQAYNALLKQQQAAADYFTKPSKTTADIANQTAKEQGAEFLPVKYDGSDVSDKEKLLRSLPGGYDLGTISQGGNKIVNLDHNIGGDEKLTPVSGKGVESLKISEDPKLTRAKLFVKRHASGKNSVALQKAKLYIREHEG